MDHDEFLEAVRRCAVLGSGEAAERITEATLATVVERLTEKQVEDLAAHLPPETARYLRSARAQEHAEAFALGEIVDRIGERVDARDPGEAASHAKAVMRTVKEATTVGEAGNERTPVPQGLAPLFEPGVGESGLPGAGG